MFLKISVNFVAVQSPNGLNKNGVENVYLSIYPTVTIKAYQIFVRLSLYARVEVKLPQN
jgi:hypothetical protein